MIGVTRQPTETTAEVDEILGALIDELTDRLQAGEAIDLESYVRRHPGLEGQIRGLFPALEMMASLGRSADRGAASSQPPGGDPRLDSGVLGDYRIVREVGRGGMGIVFEAVQVSLGRRVALKILPLAASIDPRHLQRFQLEAQAAAHLHHPHIVPIFAVGCDRGVHYYAMQFIDGRSLAELVADLRRGTARVPSADFDLAAEGRSPGLEPASPEPTADREPQVGPSATEVAESSGSRGAESARASAKLGLQAAEALEHAHALGVLHRDIKPANLLVQADGHLWVADFGLARFGADTDLTRTGDILGTLRYMSPEQAMARRVVVDHRTDIYSLGATLYELIAARPAFDGHDRQELLRQIALEEPAAPRLLDPTIPRDLETIVLKAMAKEPEGRYSTALELADDLRRFLLDEPIRARRPSLADRAAKWSRRHRAALASATAALVLAMTVGSALVWNQARQTDREKTQAQKAYRQNRKILDLVFSKQEQVNMWAMKLIGQANEKGLGDEGSYVKMVRDFYQDMIDQAGDDPDMAELKARSYHRVGFCRMVLRDVAGAEEAYRRSIALFDGLIARSPGQPTLSWLLASTLNDRGMLLRFSGNRAQSEVDYRRAIALRQDAAFRFTPDAEALGMLSWSDLELAGYLEDDGRAGDADSLRRQLAAFFARLEPGLPKRPGDRRAYAEAHIRYGAEWLSAATPHPRNAGAMFDLALSLDPDDPMTLNDVAWARGSRSESPRSDLALSLDLINEAVTKAPTLGALWNTLGVVRYRLGDWKGAIQALEESVRLRQGGDPFDWLFLAMARHRLGDRDQARRWFEKAAGWPQQVSTNDEELKRFRSEAEALLDPSGARPKPVGPPG
jgi:serine/threonine protein kinase/Tfp pilus assembly protein PilF